MLTPVVLSGCGGDGAPRPAVTGIQHLAGEIQGSGASFPAAYYQQVIKDFEEVAPDATVRYHAVGSGTGKKEFSQHLTDFAGTDSPVAGADGVAPGSFVYVPTVAAPITVAYNVAGLADLRLSPDTLARIFQRDVKGWRDPAIVADNPGVTLPDVPITVVHRSDGSGTTSNFTEYLVAAAPS